MMPLKLGIVGLSEAARPLAETVLTAGATEVKGYCAENVPEWFASAVRQAPRLGSPLDVINLPGLDLLLMLGSVEDVKSVIAAALAGGLKVVVLPLAEFESTFAYDLSVTAIDDGAPLTPCFLHRHSPELRSVLEQWHDASLIEIDCRLAARGKVTTLDWRDVRQSFLSLADLICWMWGDYRRVTTVTAGSDEEHPTRITMTLGGEHCPDVVVSYRTAEQSGCILQVRHPAGSRDIDLQSLTIDSSSLSSAWRGVAHSAVVGCWSDLMRAFDLLDGAQRSVRRRRTVEVSREFASERSQFKTQMTTIGCGVLSFTLFAVVALLLFGSVLDPRDSQQRESEALGLVLTQSDFETGSVRLHDDAARRLQEMSNSLTASTAVVLVEAGNDQALAKQRVEAVAEVLETAGLDNAATRIVARPLAGGTFRTVLIIGWIAALLPLAVYLLLQTLIVVTAPPAT